MPEDVTDALRCKVSLEILLLFKLRMKILTFIECLDYAFHTASNLEKA